MKLQFWGSGSVEYPFILMFIVFLWVSSVGQMNLLANYLYLYKITWYQNIQKGRKRYAEHRLRIKDKPISEILLWTPTHGRASVGQPARAYLHQLCANREYNLEYLPEAMDDKNGWGKRERESRKSTLSIRLGDNLISYNRMQKLWFGFIVYQPL